MKIRLLIQILCCLVFSVMSSTAFATWYTANGTGSDRNDAVNDAIRNVMLQAGADVKIEQNYKNGVLQSDNVNIMSRSPIKKLVVMSEQTTFSKVTVTIKLLLMKDLPKQDAQGLLYIKLYCRFHSDLPTLRPIRAVLELKVSVKS